MSFDKVEKEILINGFLKTMRSSTKMAKKGKPKPEEEKKEEKEKEED